VSDLGGRPFWKMSGSGNDFVFFDARAAGPGRLADPETVRRICARRTGVGADGIVFLEPFPEGDFRMRYYNADGSRASMCGNAALCSAWLAVELGFAAAEGFHFATDAGVLTGRIREGLPEVDLEPVREVALDVAVDLGEGESRIGFALAGVPHAVILCADAAAVQVDERGRTVRWSSAFPEGANVDFVSPAPGGWRMRTFERGVEGETLACGTGAVASAAVLAAWAGGSGGTTRILTSSGLPLEVSFRSEGEAERPTLRGSAKLVFRGSLGEVG
jgi:diaminopimelate epimerase